MSNHTMASTGLCGAASVGVIGAVLTGPVGIKGTTISINGGGGSITGTVKATFAPRNMFDEPQMIEGPVRQYAGFGSAPVSRFMFQDHIGPDFKPTGELHVSDYDLSSFGQDHYVVWTKLAKNEGIGDYGFMTFLPSVQPRLVFNCRESRDQFDNWMTAYRERFFPNVDMTTVMMPRLPDNSSIRGVVMSRGQKRGKSDGTERNYDMFEIWCWIVEHTTGRLWLTDSHIIFEDENSAFAYKMRWL